MQHKLETLKLAAEQANEHLQKGKITQQQYDALQREIQETEQTLKSLEAQAARKTEVRNYGTTTQELFDAANWLKSNNCEMVASLYGIQKRGLQNS